MFSNLTSLLEEFLRKNNPDLWKKSQKNCLVINFSASWCRACQQLEENINQLLKTNPQVLFFKVDVENNMDLAEKFSISSLPTSYLFWEGKIVKGPLFGTMSLPELKKFIEL